MAKNNIPVPFELAQRFIEDFNFLRDYRESNADFYNNPTDSQIHRDVMITASESLIDTVELVLDALYDHSPAEFSFHCSNKPQRCLTDKEQDRAKKYFSE